MGNTETYRRSDETSEVAGGGLGQAQCAEEDERHRSSGVHVALKRRVEDEGGEVAKQSYRGRSQKIIMMHCW